MKYKVNVSDISKFRTELMGVATLMILVCHSLIGSYSINVSGIIRHLIGLGNQGVDLFLFLSGVGIYYSLKQYKDKTGNWGGV